MANAREPSRKFQKEVQFNKNMNLWIIKADVLEGAEKLWAEHQCLILETALNNVDFKAFVINF